MSKQASGAGDAKPAKSGGISDAILDLQGVGALLELGAVAGEELRRKNRYMVGLFVCLVVSLIFNIILYNSVPEPRLLGETTDGRIRELPLLNAPMYSDKEILAWAERCVVSIYNLSYVDWQKTLQNETRCLSDNGQQGFVTSLREVGVLSYLNPDKQGVIYAVPQGAVLRKGWLAPQGYHQWVIEVPYRLSIDGRQRGSIELVMQMQIRRVSLTWREDGLWVENYIVKARSGR